MLSKWFSGLIMKTYEDCKDGKDSDMCDDKVEKLREELKDYYGTAMASGFGMAVLDLAKVDRMTDEEIKELAKKNGLEVSE